MNISCYFPFILLLLFLPYYIIPNTNKFGQWRRKKEERTGGRRGRGWLLLLPFFLLPLGICGTLEGRDLLGRQAWAAPAMYVWSMLENSSAYACLPPHHAQILCHWRGMPELGQTWRWRQGGDRGGLGSAWASLHTHAVTFCL